MTAEKAKTPKVKKKKSNPNEEAQRMQGGSVGEILLAAREQKGLSLEDISSAINVRVVQLRAIEEGNFDELPGMTYALGFVKSYAAHLKLDSAGIVQKFKTEYGHPQAANQHLHFPEPITDGPQPDKVIIAAAVFFVLLVLGIWAVFSGGEDETIQAAEEVPPAPVVETVTGITPQSSLTGTNLLNTPSPAPAVPTPLQPAPPLAAETEAVASTTFDTSAPAAAVPAPVVAEAAPQAPAPAQPVIKVSRGKSRVVIEAAKDSWIEVKDADGNSVFKKVLRTGDQYVVPGNGISHTLLTTNAGGLTILVDGKKVQAIGGKGEIVRGVELDPEELQKVRVKTGR